MAHPADDTVVASSESTPPVPCADMVVARSSPPPLAPPPEVGKAVLRNRPVWGRRQQPAEARPLAAYCPLPTAYWLSKWFTVPKLSGLCMLMKRTVYEKIGGLDERFGLGFFDDDDLAERAKRAGFELAVAHDLFVHHFGSRTFAGNGIDAGKLLDENARRFADKWGLPTVNGISVALRPWSAGSGAHARRDERPPCVGEENHTQSRKDAKNASGRMPGMVDALQDRSRIDRGELTPTQSNPSSPSSFAPWRLGVRSSLPEESASTPTFGERARVSLARRRRRVRAGRAREAAGAAGKSRTRGGPPWSAAA